MKLNYNKIFSYRILFCALFVLWKSIECRKVPAVRQEFDDYEQSQLQPQSQRQYYQIRANRNDKSLVDVGGQQQQQQQTAAFILIPAPETNSRSDNYISLKSSKSNQKQYRELSLNDYQPQSHSQPRIKEVKNAPVQTIRNYNKVNDDGSFTFGYEAADGSFKEETRGTDCVVRGKYGYVDPDGNKREFTYVSGNPCDPNAPKDSTQNDDYDSESNTDTETDTNSEPENYPKKSVRPSHSLPATTVLRKPVTFFQNVYSAKNDRSKINFDNANYNNANNNNGNNNDGGDDDNDDDDGDNNHDNTDETSSKSYQSDITKSRQVKANLLQAERFLKQNAYVSTTPATLLFQNGFGSATGSGSSIEITPRPAKLAQYLSGTASVTSRPALALAPATTYRPQLVQISVTPKNFYYTNAADYRGQKPAAYSFATVSDHAVTQTLQSAVTTTPRPPQFNFLNEFQKYNQPNTVKLLTSKKTEKPLAGSTEPIYASQLVFDPSSGQYNTALFQSVPHTNGNFLINHQIQPYVHQTLGNNKYHSSLSAASNSNSPIFQYFQPKNIVSGQALYQQQQAGKQIRNSQKLYDQQQKIRSVQQQFDPVKQYLIIPQSSNPNQHQISRTQLEDFIRGNNIQL